MPFIRYEILLPLKYNDGTSVEAEKFQQTKVELLERFQGLTIDPGTIRGLWVYRGEQFEDELIRLIVDGEDTPETEQFFREFKERLNGKVPAIGYLDGGIAFAHPMTASCGGYGEIPHVLRVPLDEEKEET